MYGVNLYVRRKLVKVDMEISLTYDAGMTTTARAPLTRSRIVDAAVTFADEFGVDALSMRKLGAVLGVEAMSLYNHVDNKDDIYDGMIDYVFTSIPLPDPDMNWKDSVRWIGTAAMERFAQHPWVVSLLMSRGNFGPGALAFMDHVLAVFIEAGFSDEDTHHAWQMLASHTMGYTFQQATNQGAVEEKYDSLDAQLARLGEHFPHVARMAPLLAQCEFGREYVFGLEIIIDGLDARLG
ncbi:MAG: TetR/AcrR family transcriptional regulator C-terminal domain-containing protein [Acidimicrobiia bacterium]|nr:MAG: TetR/AcrR family transcriptional regulator C-terminal domain-containing protein [Acidimicrobiia bacterium]